LVDQGKRAAAGLVDIDEVEDDVMGAGLHERLGQECVVRRLVGAPGAAVDEDVDRRVRLSGAVDVELLDLGRSVGNAGGSADRGARALAVGNPALGDLVAVGRVDDLVVGVVELLLVHVEPDSWTLGARGLRPRAAARGHCRAAGGGKDTAPRGVVVLHGHAAFVMVPPLALSTTSGLSNQAMVGSAP